MLGGAGRGALTYKGRSMTTDALAQLVESTSDLRVVAQRAQELCLSRALDGQTATLTRVSAQDAGSTVPDEPPLWVVRWEEALGTGAPDLGVRNAQASLAVFSTHRYGRQDRPGETILARAQLSTRAPLESLLGALAHDFGRTSVPFAPATARSPAEVQERLNTSAPPTVEEALLLAMFGEAGPPPDTYYRLEGHEVVGPSTVGADPGGRSVPVRIRVDANGLLRVRHERAETGRVEDAEALDRRNGEDSSDEALVGYTRVFCPEPARWVFEVTCAFEEVGTHAYVARLRGLEHRVASVFPSSAVQGE